MSLGTGTDRSSLRGGLPPAEVAAPIVALFFLPIWIELFLMTVRQLGGLPRWVHPYYETGILSVVWLGAFVALFAVVRPVDRFWQWPDRESPGVVAAAGVVPAALVLFTDFVAGIDGQAYVRLSETPAPLFALPSSSLFSISFSMWLLMVAVWFVVGVAVMVAVVHLVVQASLRDTAGPTVAAGVATAVGAVVLVGQDLDFAVAGSGFPVRGNIAALLLWIAVLGLALLGATRTRRRWLRWLTAVPLCLLGLATAAQLAGFVDSGGLIRAELDWAAATVPAATYVGAQALVVALAVYGYERTRSICTPAVAYCSTYLTSAVVAGVFEAPHLF